MRHPNFSSSKICTFLLTVTPRPVTDATTFKPEEILHSSSLVTPTSKTSEVETNPSDATSTLAVDKTLAGKDLSSTASTNDVNPSSTMASTTELPTTTTTSPTTETPSSTTDTTTALKTTEATTQTTPDTTTEATTVATTTLPTTPETTPATSAVSETTTQERTSTASTTLTTTTQPVTSTEATSSPTTPMTTPTTRPTTTTLTSTQSTSTAASTSQRTTPPTTQPPRRTTKAPAEDWNKAIEAFKDCYIPSTGVSLEETVKEARKFYTKHQRSCPSVQIGNLKWEITSAGHTGNASCANGDGVATFQCDAQKMCWRGQPDISGCASKKLQSLLKQVQQAVEEGSSGQLVTEPPPTIEQSVDLSQQLVQVTQSEDTTLEDVIVASQVITTLTQADTTETQDDTQVEAIVRNVVQTGSNFVSTNKSEMWESMSKEDKVRSASTLLVAMETATATMAEKIDKPAVIKKTDANIELELRVLNVSILEKEKKNELVYDSSQSDSSFSIPIETLKSVSKGVLAKAVFMTHYSMSDLLGGRTQKRQRTRQYNTPPAGAADSNTTENAAVDVDEKDTKNDKDNEDKQATGPQIVSYILSATFGVEASVQKLPKPISFTMRHIEEIDDRYFRLCSFWNVSQQTQLGFWSQEGCRIVRTNKSHTTCECDHMTNFAILLNVHNLEVSKTHESLLRLVTIIGCVISCVSLLASWVTFQCFTSLQGERNSIHKNLAFTLLVAEIVFVVGIEQVQHQILCSVIAGVLHFFFLAAFMWMFIEGLHIIFMLVQVFDASRSRLPYYYLTGYGVPLAVVGASCLFYYKGYGTEKFCWLTTDRYFIWAFAGPVAMILLVNAFFLTYAMSTVCRHSDYVFSSKEKTTGSGIRAWIQGALAIEVLLGLTWTLGYFLINEDSLPLAYVFATLNSLQGLFIFVFHCLLNKKAQKEYRLMARTVVKRSPSTATSHSTLTKRTNHTNTNSHDNNHSPTNSHQKLNRDSLA
ncbi:hypothetical protein BsWGS_02778 [Bradybaena similaris]